MVWRWRPEVALPLAIAVVVYAVGWARLARRGPVRSQGRAALRLATALAGLVVVAVALLGLHEAAHERFRAHMVQHVLLMMVGVPLLLLANPLPAILWALPASLRARAGVLLGHRALPRRGWEVLTRLPVAWTLHALVLWLWHLPAAYDAALASAWIHDVEHAAFGVAAVVFWWPVIGPAPRPAVPPSDAARVVYLVLAALSSSALGVLLAASPAPLYAYPGLGDGASALDDQAWGGIVMWAVGGAIETTAVLALVARTVGGARTPLDARQAVEKSATSAARSLTRSRA
jgi:cytochrome c oxidase assembly factor CtaG